MTKSHEELMALRFGGASVAENLRRAVTAGELVEGEDGALRLPDHQSDVGNWMFVRKGRPLECNFLMHFLFERAYAKSAVPQGCTHGTRPASSSEMILSVISS